MTMCLCGQDMHYTTWDANILECSDADCARMQCECPGSKSDCEVCGIYCCDNCHGIALCDACNHHRLPEDGCIYCNPHVKLPDDVTLCASYLTSQINEPEGELSWCQKCEQVVDNTIHKHMDMELSTPTKRQAVHTEGYMGKCQFCDNYRVINKMCDSCETYCCIICADMCNRDMQDTECYECEKIMW